ncbi:MAG: cobaltochelatase subunit CobN [Methanolobus sp.]|nr:cobaltochelatase subunit CobN [Methanolobus sp.]
MNSADITDLEIELAKDSGIDENKVLAYLDMSSITGATYSAGMTGNNYKESTLVLIDRLTDKAVANTISDSEGNFVLADIPNGEYILYAVNYSSGKGGVWSWYNAELDITVDSADITDLEIELVKDSGIDENKVLAYLDKSSIAGVTYSAGMTGNNYKSSTVVLVDKLTEELIANTISDTQGNFILADIPNGEYVLYAVNYSSGKGGAWSWYNAELDITVDSADITDLEIELAKDSGIDENKVLAYLDKSSITGVTYSAGMTGNNYKSSTIILLKQRSATEFSNAPHLNVSIITGYSSYKAKLEKFVQRINSNSDLNITASVYLTTEVPDNIDLSNMDIIYIVMVTQTASEFAGPVQEAIDNGALVIGQNTYLPESNYNPPSDTNYNTTDTFKAHLNAYWKGAILEDTNFDNLIFYLAKEYYGRTDLKVEDPSVIPSAIYHPAMTDTPGYLVTDVEEYFEWYTNRTDGHVFDENAPTIGITFYSSYLDGMDPVNKLIEGFENRGVNVIACYGDANNHVNGYLNYSAETKVDAVVSFLYRGNHFDIEELGVPVMNAILNGYMNTSQWIETSTPLPVTNMLRIYGPETEGLIDPIMIGAQENIQAGSGTVAQYIAQEGQVQWLVDRTIAQANLGIKNEAEKKVAIIYYNHGGGKDNIGASYLEVTPSIVNLLEGMADTGYDVDINLIPNRTELVDLMIHQGRNVGTWAPGELEALVETGEVELIPESTYLSWFNELSEERREEVTEMWGEAPGEIMVYTDDNGDKFIVIPKISLSDNVILAPQPTRGWLQDNEVLYHDEELPPHHQYIAFYLWLQHEFDADVMVNMGRHGTVEWLPGKDFCLLSDEWPAIMVGDIPVIYPYVMDGMGEGMQAKRRGNAVVIDHLIPPVISAGLYGNYSLLSSEITTYHTSASEESLKQAHLQEIVNLTLELGLDDQVNMSLAENNESVDHFLDELTDVLYELRSQSMPYGLHVLGEAPEGQALVGMVNSMLGDEFSTMVAIYNDSESAPTDLLSLVLLENVSTTDAQMQILLGNSTADISTKLNTSINYAKLLSESENEIQQVLKVMNGEYINPNLGGDPVLRPETLPSGSNFYAFDEQLIPTKQAWEDGKALVDQWLAEYYAANGEYPTKVGYILWAGESTRHEGIMESQLLYMMGIEPVWNDDSSKVEDVRYINSTELGRPRIDVIVQISGLYRDTFPMKVQLIDKAVRLAYEQGKTDEYDNYVTRNTDTLQLVLNETIQDGNLSLDIAQFRIFGPADGAYGTGMANAVDASDTWENNTELAELYIDKMSYVYGQNIWGQTIEEYIGQQTGQSIEIDDSLLFENNLNDTRAIFHSRSSSTYGSLDTDDFYQYMGGLYNAIKYISGDAPEAYVVNLQDLSDLEIQTLQTYIANEMYARYFNPTWISGMQQHGFEGAREMESFLENLWGWEALDPDLISDDVWDKVYENYFANAELSGWLKENNPYAYQSMVARMTETIRKDSWDASDETMRSLVSEQIKSVIKSGATCCHHTCGNILNQEFVDGIAPALVETGEISQDELDLYREIMKIATTATEKTANPATSPASSSSSSSTGKDLNIVETSSGNQTTMNDAGAGADLDKEASVKSPSQDNYVEGYEMTKESVVQDTSSSGPSISGSDVIASLFVVAGVGAIYFGFWRRRGV